MLPSPSTSSTRCGTSCRPAPRGPVRRGPGGGGGAPPPNRSRGWRGGPPSDIMEAGVGGTIVHVDPCVLNPMFGQVAGGLRYQSLRHSQRVLERMAPLVRFGLFAAGVSVFLDQAGGLFTDAQFTW